MAVIIGGGSGFIGKALTNSLRDQGKKVYWISRHAKGNSQLSWTDISRNGLPLDVTHVVNLAGRNISELSPAFCVPKYYQEFKNDLFESRISTCKLLAKTIENNSKIKAFITASAVGFYKPDLEKTYTEAAPFEKNSFIQDLVFQWETSARLNNCENVRQIPIRIGLVLDRSGGVLQKMEIPFKVGLGGPVGSGRQWMSWIHMRDLVGLFQFALYNDSLSSGPLNGSAPNPVRQMVFAKELGKAMHRPAFIPTTSMAIKMIYGDRSELLLEGVRMMPERAVSAGFNFSYSHLADALKNLYS